MTTQINPNKQILIMIETHLLSYIHNIMTLCNKQLATLIFTPVNMRKYHTTYTVIQMN